LDVNPFLRIGLLFLKKIIFAKSIYFWIKALYVVMVAESFGCRVMSANFCPHLIFKFGDLIEFSVLKD